MSAGIVYVNWNDIFDESKKLATDYQLTQIATAAGIGLKIDYFIPSDNSSKYYQYGRVPFRLLLEYQGVNYTKPQEMSVINTARVVIVDDMSYTLPPFKESTRWWIWMIVAGAVIVVG